MKSGNQEQICVKLDRSVLAALELEHGVSALPRNRIINRSLVAYTQAIDMVRSYKAGMISTDGFINWFMYVYSKWLCDKKGSMSLVINKEGGE